MYLCHGRLVDQRKMWFIRPLQYTCSYLYSTLAVTTTAHLKLPLQHTCSYHYSTLEVTSTAHLQLPLQHTCSYLYSTLAVTSTAHLQSSHLGCITLSINWSDQFPIPTNISNSEQWTNIKIAIPWHKLVMSLPHGMCSYTVTLPINHFRLTPSVIDWKCDCISCTSRVEGTQLTHITYVVYTHRRHMRV